MDKHVLHELSNAYREAAGVFPNPEGLKAAVNILMSKVDPWMTDAPLELRGQLRSESEKK